jgi:hypothetical protein
MSSSQSSNLDDKDEKSPSASGVQLHNIEQESDTDEVALHLHIRTKSSLARQEAVEEKLRASFDTFDVGEHGELNATTLFAIINLHLPDDDTVDWTLFTELFDDYDKDFSGAINCEQFIQVFRETVVRTKSKIASQGRFKTILISFAALVLWPLMILAHPGRSRDSAFRYVYIHAIRIFYLPYPIRQWVSTSWAGFLIAYFCGILIFFANWAGAAAGVHYVNKQYEIRVSGLEFAVPVISIVFNSFLIAILINIDERPNIAEQRRLLRSSPLGNMQVVATLDEHRDTTMSGERLLAYVLYESPTTRKYNVWWRRANNIIAMTAAWGFAVLPFVVRFYEGFSLLGNCRTYDSVNGDICEKRDDTVFAWLAIQSALLVPGGLYWFLSTLLFSYFTFAEQLQLNLRMDAILRQTQAASNKLPWIEFDDSRNVVAWSALRHYLDNFKQGAVRGIEIVVGFTLFPVIGLIVLILYQRLIGFNSTINESVVLIYSGFMMSIVGTYIVHPLLSLGLAINYFRDRTFEFFSSEKWRLTLAAETAETSQECDQLRHSQALTRGQYELQCESDSQFKILGVAVNKALVVSIGTTVASSLVAWVSSILLS